MGIPKGQVVVLEIAGDTVRVECDGAAAESILGVLGFVREEDQFVMHIVNDEHRRTLVHELIQMNALFAAGRDWSPAELVDFYREQGIVTRGYRMIAWTNPDTYVIVDKQ